MHFTLIHMVNIIGQHACYQAQRYHVFSLVNYVAFGLLCGRVFVLRFSLHQESSYDVIIIVYPGYLFQS